MDELNPRNIAALFVADASPRWLYGHTCLNRNPDPETVELARVREHITPIAMHCEWGLHLPPRTLDTDQRHRVNVSDLVEQTVALAGLYGGQCIQEIADWLEQNGLRVIQVRDAIVWPPDETPCGTPGETLFPGVHYPEGL